MREWDYDKNTVDPKTISCFSNKKIYWKCKLGHCWQTKVTFRSLGSNCPYCQGNKVSEDKTFGNVHPELIKEWDYNKNTIDPFKIGCGNHTRVWWKCSNKGHEWQSTTSNRHFGTGCPLCKSIVLKNGSICASLPEAYWHIVYSLYNGKQKFFTQ